MPSKDNKSRFTKTDPCPICRGYDQAPRGKGERCFGFGSSDLAHCTRPERAGRLQENPASRTYPHKLIGDCGCGIRHDTGPAPTAASGKSERRQIVATYPYHDEAGEVAYEVVRTEPKGFFQRRPDVAGWVNSLQGVKRLPYRLPQLVAAPKGSTVYVPEGEKDCDRLAAEGVVSTCNSEGAGKFRPALVPYFEGMKVVIVPDNDDTGRRHAEAVARTLHGVAASVRVWEWVKGEVPEGGDVSDWLDADHTVEELLSLADVLVEYEPPTTVAVNGANGQQQPVPTLNIVTLADIPPTEVSWLWPLRLPRGKLSLIAGDPGLGKSYLMLDLAARVSLGGLWPDGGDVDQGDVLIITAEDAVSDTIRPRADALGADPRRIHMIGVSVREGEKDLAFSLLDHIGLIHQAIADYGASLLILDPLLAFTGGQRVDANKTHEVRPVLMRVSEVAEVTGCSVVGIMHLNKDSRQAKSIYRISSSLAFAASARSILGVGKHPDDESRRVFVGLKHNLSAEPPGLSYCFVDGVFAWDPGTVDIDSGRLFEPPAARKAKNQSRQANSWTRS